MKNPVLNYNQFMTKAKSAKSGYDKKANTKQIDKDGIKVKPELSNLDGKGSDKNTASIQRYTKEFLSRVSKKSAVSKK